MNVKVLFASFALVFLAELGDKTQLTALAFSASTRSPWAVFFGTSLALITTTALAVIFGEMLSRVLPERVLHIGSGVMFVLVGLVLLVNEARKAPAAEPKSEPVEAVAAEPVAGFLSKLVLREAILFEEEMVEELLETAKACNDAALRSALEDVAREDQVHIASLKKVSTGLVPADDRTMLPDATQTKADPPPPVADVLAAIKEIEARGEENPLHKTIRKQEAIAEFYISLARMAHLHDTRDTLRWLAMEEIRHAQHLCTLVNHDDQPEVPPTAVS